MIDYIAKTEEIRQYTEAHIKKSRYEHSIRVAEMCARMCRQYGMDARKGYLAGIGHDMCKGCSDEECGHERGQGTGQEGVFLYPLRLRSQCNEPHLPQLAAVPPAGDAREVVGN